MPLYHSGPHLSHSLLASYPHPMLFPSDINVEILLDYLNESHIPFKVAFKGLHKRNTYHDIVEMDVRSDGTHIVDVSRNSIYNALPEYLFHPIDRFSHLPRLEEKERFAEELEKQEREKEDAYRFFAPMDVQLLLYAMDIRRTLRPITETNSILHDILADRLDDKQRSNPFIKASIPFLPECKHIRGNKTLLTIYLRKIFTDEGMSITVADPAAVPSAFPPVSLTDATPRYADGLNATLDDTYVGNTYDENITTFTIHYWPEQVDDHFLELVDEIETFRLFVQDYFMSVEDVLHFNISHDDPPLRLTDDVVFNYLDYNTNI